MTDERIPRSEVGILQPEESGRFILFYGGPTGFGRAYAKAFDTWEECAKAFPIDSGYRLEDTATGRVWRHGYAYEWEAAQT